MDQRLLKPEEVASRIGLGRSKTYALLAAGVLPSVRIGGSIRVPAEALARWVKQKTRDAQQKSGGSHGND